MMSDFKSQIAEQAHRLGRSLTPAEVMAVNGEYIKWADKEITTLRQQLAEREARVAELEATLYHGNLEREKCQKAMILRKQAEAADECLHLLKQPEGEFQMRNYADGLRNQADELEKAGGE